jgi:lipopolysaccharide export system permease protein
VCPGHASGNRAPAGYNARLTATGDQGSHLILYRYINRQLFVTTVVVTVVLTAMVVGTRFVQYLAEAVRGEIAAEAIFGIVAFRLPEFLELILPLSMYIGILLVFGRLHVDNEMVVMRSGGIGPVSLLRGLSTPIVMMTLLVGFCSLYATPRGAAEESRLMEEQEQRSALELLAPGRFHERSTDTSRRTTYAESLDREAGALNNIFISDLRKRAEGRSRILIVRARTGRIVHRDGMRYLQLSDGVQYRGRPGRADYGVADFDRSLVRLGDNQAPETSTPIESRPSRELLDAGQPRARAELQWRVSLVLLVPVTMLLALPLSRAGPRQGPFARMLPAVLLFMLYVGGLLVMRTRIEDYGGPDLPWYLHMLWIHVAAALVVTLVYAWPRLVSRSKG